jgi:transcriptional regulator with XRE-family HTH domain
MNPKKERAMGATQIDIAKAVGVDVSSVNKILNGKCGPVFRKSTIDKVFKTAKKLGYDFGKASKGRLVAALVELFPPQTSDKMVALARGVPIEKVAEIRALIRRAGGAALVLIALRIIIGQ